MITYEQVLAVANEVVAEFGPDYVYKRPPTDDGSYCRYVWEDEPSCLVGQIMHRLGVHLAWMAEREGDSASYLVDAAFGEEVEPDVRTFLNSIQLSQDLRVPWGVAVARAEQQIGLHKRQDHQ